MLPDSKRDQDRLLGAGGLGGEEQRKKPGPSRPSYLGSLNGFQIKTGGCPGPTPGGAVFQETCGSRQVQGQAQRLPQLVALFTVPAQANPAASRRGPEATASLQGRSWFVLIFPVVLGSKQEQGCGIASFFSCHYTHTSQPSQANPTRPSLCQSKCQPSLPPCCASD